MAAKRLDTSWRWLVIASLSVWPIYYGFGWIVGYTSIFDGVSREALGWTVLLFDLALISVSIAIVVALFRHLGERPTWAAVAAAFPAGMFAVIFIVFMIWDIVV